MIELNYSKKQVKPLIEKYGINVEKDKNFHDIITMFDGQTTYHLWAIKLYYDKVCSLDVLNRVKLWTDVYKNEIKNLIKKNVTAYVTSSDIQQLFHEMRGLEIIKTIRDGASQFNTDQKKIFIDRLLKFENGIPLNGLEIVNNVNLMMPENWSKLFTKISKLPQIRKDKLIRTSSALRNINDLKAHLENSLTATYEWNREDLLAYVENNTPDCGIAFDSNNVIVLSVPSFTSSQSLCGKGRTCWCLTREERYFRQYVTDNCNAKQYFLFDFNKREDHELAHIGFTVVKEHGITNAHSTSNNNMMGDGIMVDGDRVSIHKALKKCNIPLSTYITIEKPSYSWEMENVLKMISQNTHSLAISCSKNNCLVINVLSIHGLNILMKHTAINIANQSIPRNGKVYVVMNFNVDFNHEDACFIMFYEGDRYGSISLNRTLNLYNVVTEININDLGIKTSDYLNRESIDPKILLHKLIHENQEEEAVELVKNSKELDVNFTFESTLPIFSAIENKMYKLFTTIINHPKFDSKNTDGYGETILHRLLYAYDTTKEKCHENNENIYKMINAVLDNDLIDLNVQDINAETALSVACGELTLTWVVERLVNNTKVNVNIADDFNFTPLGTAINAKNIEAIRILGNRPDLVIRKRDVENAKKQGFNLYDIIAPNDNSEDDLIIQNEINELSEIFAKAFGCL